MQRQVVGFRAVDLVRRGDDGLAVENVRLVDLEEIGAGAFEVFQGVRSLAIEHADAVHDLFQRTAKMPVVVVRVVIVWRHGDGQVLRLESLEQLFKVLDGVVLDDALAEHRPTGAGRAEEVVLRVDDHQSGFAQVEFETSARQCGFGGVGVQMAHDDLPLGCLRG
ncbi:hypothetical protein D3C73_1007040 [compost metagenome]